METLVGALQGAVGEEPDEVVEAKALVSGFKRECLNLKTKSLSPELRAKFAAMVPAAKAGGRPQSRKDAIGDRLRAKDAEADFFDRITRIEEEFQSSIDEIIEGVASPEEKASAFDELLSSYATNLKALYAEINWTMPGTEPGEGEPPVENQETAPGTEEEPDTPESKNNADGGDALSALVEKIDQLLSALAPKSKSEEEPEDSAAKSGGVESETPEETLSGDEEVAELIEEAVQAIKSKLGARLGAKQSGGSAAKNASAPNSVTLAAIEKLGKSVEVLVDRVQQMEGVTEKTVKSLFGLSDDDITALLDGEDEGSSDEGQAAAAAKGKGGSVGGDPALDGLKTLLGELGHGASSRESEFGAAAKDSGDRNRRQRLGAAAAGKKWE